MIKQASIALTAGLLFASVAAASAAGTQSPSPNSQVRRPAGDTLSLTSTERTTAWNDLHSRATEQKAPSSFSPTVGSILPSTIKIEPVPSKVASAVPALKAYDFAMVEGKLLIVNPSDKKIVEAIKG